MRSTTSFRAARCPQRFFSVAEPRLHPGRDKIDKKSGYDCTLLAMIAGSQSDCSELPASATASATGAASAAGMLCGFIFFAFFRAGFFLVAMGALELALAFPLPRADLEVLRVFAIADFRFRAVATFRLAIMALSSGRR